VRELWGNQPVEPVQASADDLRRKAQRFEAKTRREFRMAVALLIVLAAGYGSFLFFFPGTVQRIGSGLALSGFLSGAYQLYRRGPARKVPPGPASATCAAYRAELERQRDFRLGAWSRLVAFVPGPVVFLTGFLAAEQGLAERLGLAMLLAAAPFAVGIPLNLWSARKLQREIDALDALT